MPTQTAQIGGVTLHLGTPDATEQGWIGQDAVLRQLLACWLVVDPSDRPLSPRLLGPPGIGKTTLAMAAARPIRRGDSGRSLGSTTSQHASSCRRTASCPIQPCSVASGAARWSVTPPTSTIFI